MASEEISAKVEGKYLVVRIRMQKAKPSASGKTMVVASTHGNKEVDCEVDGETLRIGLNAYYYAKE